MNQTENGQLLGEEKISKLMLKFSVPCVLSLLVSALYNIVDQIFIGNSELSALGNAATGVVFPIFIIAQAFAWCFGDGCTSIDWQRHHLYPDYKHYPDFCLLSAQNTAFDPVRRF